MGRVLLRPTRTSPLLLRLAGRAAKDIDERYHPAGGVRRQLNKVFPTHWSFLLGEIALYSFIVLVLSGTYLALFYDPSMADVRYNGPYSDLRGIEMSRAYASTLDISFVVRGGLFVRQLHHWAALLFVAAMAMHMLRIFFTGAFRKPRETNWVIGMLLLILGGAEGFTGYSLPDDLLSGTGVRAAVSGGILSVPIIGTWLHWLGFGGEFPGHVYLPRFYSIHILLIPGLIAALIGVHLGVVWFQKHTQFPGVRRTEQNVVGERIMPRFAVTGLGWFAAVFGVLAIIAGLFQINPVWQAGPYDPAQVSTGAQPDWYMGWTEGMLRTFPDWEINFGHRYLIPAPFWALVVVGVVLAVMIAYPAIERRLSGDRAHHNLLQRPRDVPVRTSLGAMGVMFFVVTTIAGGDDVIAYKFGVSLNAVVWGLRIGVLILPPIAYYVAYRMCVGLQRADREVLEHGIETGIIKRLPHGEFIEVHQPLGGTDENGEPVTLDYQGAPVPAKMNKLGLAGRAVAGSLLTPDPRNETIALDQARNDQRAGTNSSGRTGPRTSEPSID
jgi:ubiquinol-cytochrome c reductase cytochrome b subunit